MSETQRPSSPVIPAAVSRRGEAMRDATHRGHLRIAHIRRCQAAGRPGENEIRRMIDDYLAHGGQIQLCKPAYVLPVQNGSGRAEVRS